MANPKTVNEKEIRELLFQGLKEANLLTKSIYLKGLGRFEGTYRDSIGRVIGVITRQVSEEEKNIKNTITYFGTTLPPKIDWIKDTWFGPERNLEPIHPIFQLGSNWGFFNPKAFSPLETYYIDNITDPTESQMINDLDRKLIKGVTFVEQVPYIKKLAEGFIFVHENGLTQGAIAQCRRQKRQIAFDSRHLLLMPWYEVIETLLHEIAHIYTSNKNEDHGPTWRREFNKLIAMLEEKCPGWVETVEVEVKVESNTASVSKLVNTATLTGSLVN